MIKDILTLLDLNNQTPALPVALDLAKKTSAHLTGIAPIFEPALPGYVAGPLPADIIEESRRQAEQSARDAADAFEKAAATAGITAETRLMSLATGGGTQAFTEHCRVTDLVIIGQENVDKPEIMRAALTEAALFDGSAPLLLIPYIGAEHFKPSRVMIGWDGGKTAAKAVHAALPVLEMAEQIDVVIAGNPTSVAGEPGADLAVYLARHGLKVEIKRIPGGSTSVADTMLNYISDNGVDLAVMGGYGHSRVREFILGGATRGMLEAMTVPVLMAH